MCISPVLAPATVAPVTMSRDPPSLTPPAVEPANSATFPLRAESARPVLTDICPDSEPIPVCKVNAPLSPFAEEPLEATIRPPMPTTAAPAMS